MTRYSDYDSFAWIYNKHWGYFGRRVLPVLDKLMLKYLPTGAHILDLCCGTGQLAQLLTSRGYKVTSGITREIFQKVFSKPPEAEEIQRLINRFVSLLKESYTSKTYLINEIIGARYILRRLLETSDWKIAIATGGWYTPAIYKLKCARISIEGLPLSTANDAFSRENIVLNCIAKSQSHYGVEQFSKIVGVGDGVWDIKTAKALRLPFIGVGDKAHLTQLGAVHVVQDYRDPDGFIQLLEDAKIPNF